MKRFFALLLLFCLSIHAKEECKECLEAIDCKQCFMPKNARLQEEPLGFFLYLDVLFWQAKQRGLEYVIKNKVPATTHFDGVVIDPDFEWRPGYRVALGVNLPHDEWDLSLFFTHFDIKSYNTAMSGITPNASAGPGLVPVWIHSVTGRNLRFAGADATWKFNYNVGDLFLQKRFCVGKELDVKPYWGLKNAYLTQRYVINYNQANQPFDMVMDISSNIHLKNITFGLGPMIGFETNWNLSPNWSFFFDGSGSLLATHFDVSHNQGTFFSDPNPSEDSVHFEDDFWSYKPEAQLRTGIRVGWCQPKRNQTMKYIGISFAYEAQYWWQQNQIPRFINPIVIGQTINTQGDLFLQGFNFELRADF